VHSAVALDRDFLDVDLAVSGGRGLGQGRNRP
jgi:hypothetical protein